MAKRIVLLSLLLLPLMAACSLLDNNVKEFGNVDWVGDQTIINDTTYFDVDGVRYVDVGTAEEKIAKGDYIAAKNGKDNYSYQFYTLPDETYSGILYVHTFSKLNMASYDRIYVSRDVVSIPTSLLYGFPHKDTWLDGGAEKTMFGEIYVQYGSFLEGVMVGESIGEAGSDTYYSVEGHPQWICTKSKTRTSMYDIYYQTRNITELPVDIVWAIHTYE